MGSFSKRMVEIDQHALAEFEYWMQGSYCLKQV